MRGVDDAMDAAKDDDDDGQSGTRPPCIPPSQRIAFAVLCCVASEGRSVGGRGDEADVCLVVRSPSPVSPSPVLP